MHDAPWRLLVRPASDDVTGVFVTISGHPLFSFSVVLEGDTSQTFPVRTGIHTKGIDLKLVVWKALKEKGCSMPDTYLALATSSISSPLCSSFNRSTFPVRRELGGHAGIGTSMASLRRHRSPEIFSGDTIFLSVDLYLRLQAGLPALFMNGPLLHPRKSLSMTLLPLYVSLLRLHPFNLRAYSHQTKEKKRQDHPHRLHSLSMWRMNNRRLCFQVSHSIQTPNKWPVLKNN